MFAMLDCTLASLLYDRPALMLHLSLRSEVAILYNDRSVLENHHVSAAYRLMADEDMNIFVNLNKDDWRWEKDRVTMQWSNDFDCIYGLCFGQGAEDFGYRDGDVHRHVLSLPADQDHEECPLTDRQVRTENTAFRKSSHSIHQFDKNIDPAQSRTCDNVCCQSRRILQLWPYNTVMQFQMLDLIFFKSIF